MMKILLAIAYFYITMASFKETNMYFYIQNIQFVIEDAKKEWLNYAERRWMFYYGLWDNKYMEHYFPMDFCEYIAHSVKEDKVEEALSTLSLEYYLPDMEEKGQIVNDSGWGYFSAYYYANREMMDNANWYQVDLMSVNDIIIETTNENGQKSYIFFNHVTGEGKGNDPGYNFPVVDEAKVYFIKWKEYRYFVISYLNEGKGEGMFICDLVNENFKMLGIYLDKTGEVKINFYDMFLSDGGKCRNEGYSRYPKEMP